MTRRNAAAIGSLVALVTVVFSDVLFFGRAFYFRDLTRFYYPSKKLLAEIVRAGEFPSWNPYWAAGQPLAANPDYGVFYPLQWLTFLPGFDFWFRLLIVLHVAIAAAGAYLLLRTWLRQESAIFGAIVFSLGGLTLSLINLLPFLYCFAWLPWIALAIDRGRFAIAALLLGMAMIGGEPVSVAQVCILAGVFALVRGVRWRPLILTVALAIAAAAAQLLPAIDLLGDTARSRGFPWSLVSQWSTPPVRLADLFIPELTGPGAEHFRLYWGTAKYGWLDPFYVGVYFGLIAIALAMAGIITRLPGWRMVAAALVASMILAFGAHTPLLRFLYETRVFASFRYPEKFLALGLIPLMLFAAAAFERVMDGDRRVVRAALIVTSAVAALCATLFLASFAPSYAGRFVAFWDISIHPMAGSMAGASRSVWFVALLRSMAAVVVVWSSKYLAPRKWASLAIVLIILDLGYQRLSIAESVDGEFFRIPPRTVQQINRNVRLFHQADWYGATSVARHYLDLPEMYWVLRNGLYPMFGATWNVAVAMNRDIDATFLTPASDFNRAIVDLRQRSVPRWFEPLMAMSAAGQRALYLPFEQQVARFGNARQAIEPNIFVPVATNRIFYFADRVIPCRSPEEFIELLAHGAPTPRAAFTDWAPFTPADGNVIAIRQRSNAAEVDVQSAGNALLVCSITRHKYWHATIDGRESPLVPINVQYQGLFAPPGRHTIRMTYRNPLLFAGGAISIATLALLAVLIFREGHNVRKEVVEPPLELGARVH